LNIVAFVAMVQRRIAKPAGFGVPNADLIPHAKGQHVLAVRAEDNFAIIDPVASALAIMSRPNVDFSAVVSEQEKLSTATKHGKPVAIAAVRHAPGLGREQSPEPFVATRPVPDHELLSLRRLTVACSRRCD
jgi:hypothetical protein